MGGWLVQVPVKRFGTEATGPSVCRVACQITRTLWQQSRGRSNRLAKGQNYSLNCQMGQWQG